MTSTTYTNPEGKEFLIVQVPETLISYETFTVFNNDLICDQNDPFQLNIELPVPNKPVVDDPNPHSQYYGSQRDLLAKWEERNYWQIHSVTDKMTEEQAKDIVSREMKKLGIWPVFGYKDYNDTSTLVETAPESIETLLISLGLNPDNKHVILIKQI